MKKIAAIFLSLSFWAFTALAAESAFNSDVPDSYTVKKGDTLWDISALFLRDPWKWPEVWAANPQIDNPHLIYPGDVISLVYVDGVPKLTLQRGNVASAATGTDASSPCEEYVSGRDVKLRPCVKSSSHEDAIPAIPLEVVNSFLARTRVVDEGVLEAAPYVVAGEEKRLLSGKLDDFYARGRFDSGVDFFGIFRKDDPYIDPATGEVLGVRAEDIGSAQMKAVDGDVSTLRATRSEREIRIGDRLLPHEERRLETTFFPSAPDTDIRGAIIGVEGGLSQVGTLDVVAINRGEREGIEVGNVLAIYKAGEQIRDRVAGESITLPAERAGLMMVFRTFEKMSFGLVLSAERPLAVKDEVRMP